MDEINRNAFEDATTPHIEMLYRMALKLTRSGADADDLVQDSLVKAFRSFEKFEKGTNIRAWLCTIMTNTFINDLRKKRRFRVYAENVRQCNNIVMNDHSRDEGQPTEIDRINYDSLKFNHFSDEVANAFDDMSDTFKQVIYMADLEEMTYEEISSKLNIPVGTVMSRLFRARKTLRQSLIEYANRLGYNKTRKYTKEAI